MTMTNDIQAGDLTQGSNTRCNHSKVQLKIKEVPKYNILLIGDAQSGKSTLLQAFLRYQDPRRRVDTGAIGTGNQAHTKEVQVTSIDTDFPRYHLYDTGNENEKPTDGLTKRLCRQAKQWFVTTSTESRVDVAKRFAEARLDHCSGMLTKREAPNDELCRLNVIDTPGFKEIDHRDDTDLKSLLSKLSELGTIHLVLIVISRDAPISPRVQAALRCYSTVFSAMRVIMAFVHTHVENHDRHTSCSTLNRFMEARSKQLRDVMDCELPNYFIDCNLDDHNPVHVYIRQNTIHNILSTVKFNNPMSILSILLGKTERMHAIDNLSIEGYHSWIVERKKQFDDKVYHLLRINEIKHRIREANEHVRMLETGDVAFVGAFKQDLAWKLFPDSKMRMTIVVEDLASDEIEYRTIHGIQDILVKKKIDQQGDSRKITFCVTLEGESYPSGVCPVKLISRDRSKEIKVKLRELEELNNELNSLEERHHTPGPVSSVSMYDIEQHNQRLNELAQASRKTLPWVRFKELIDTGAYVGEESF
ncbi:hypothetical protein BGX28_008093 [Mortierella sp. GBA30]|nr:hypothetical protein BGX28_008093 [Mortierella sp. GBA30]